MDEKIFQEVGLTNAETKVYLALLKIGLTSAGKILYETGLQNSTLHKTLIKLVSKGFASYNIKGKVRYYQASDPEVILSTLKEKEAKLVSILPELKLLQKPAERQEAEVFLGFKGFKNMLFELIKDVKRGDEFLFFTFDNEKYNDAVYKYYQLEYQKERVRKGMLVKGLIPMKLKNLMLTGNTRHRIVKYVNFPIPLNISIVNDKIMFTPWEDKQVSFLIHSRQLAESFRRYFYSIFDKIK
jgi:sugar-specific transcriptional regulator TrmB